MFLHGKNWIGKKIEKGDVWQDFGHIIKSAPNYKFGKQVGEELQNL